MLHLRGSQDRLEVVLLLTLLMGPSFHLFLDLDIGKVQIIHGRQNRGKVSRRFDEVYPKLRHLSLVGLAFVAILRKILSYFGMTVIYFLDSFSEDA